MRYMTRCCWWISFFILATGASSSQTLREAADRSGMLVGTAVRPQQLSESLYATTLARERISMNMHAVFSGIALVLNPLRDRGTLR